MARLTNSKNASKPVSVSTAKGKPASKIASKPVSASLPLTVTFNADVKHISTSGKLAVFDGRKDGGPDLYLDLANVAKAFGYLPESVTVEMTVKATGKAARKVLCVVPGTMQNRFPEKKHDFEEVYGMGIAEHLASLESESAKPERLAASDKGKGKGKAESAKAESKPVSQHGEASSMVDRMNRLESLMGKLAEKLL